MGLFKSLVDKAKEKRDELGKKAAEKAAKKAAEVALAQSAKVAKTAFDSAGRVIERAIFGDVLEEKAASSEREDLEPPPDPFAKQKAAEAAGKEKARDDRLRAKERADREAKAEKDVDDELAALKKRLGK